jgi:hypothetical protein
MKRFRFCTTWWFLSLLAIAGAGGIRFYVVMQEALKTKPAKLVELYELARQRRFDELEKGTYEGRRSFRVWDEERGPVQSFKVTGIHLRLPIWGDIYGTVYRRGIPYRVVGYLENDEVNYFDEMESR